MSEAAHPSGHPLKPKKLPLPVKLVVGAVAGVVGTTCIYPIDMIKTRLQSSIKGTYLGPLDVIQKILRNEGGVGAFYRGLSANLVGVTPEKAIKLAANEYFREKLEREDGSITVLNEVLAGGGAGFCQVIATNPMEITKIRMQMQATLPLEQRMSTMQVVKSLGLRGMYTGTPATLCRDVPFSVLFFPAYANAKKALSDDRGDNSVLSLILAGFLSGSLSSAAVTPADVVKTRLQLQGGEAVYKNVLFAFQKIWREEGVAALFKGVVPRMLVVGPLFSITLLSFEAQKSYMIKHGLL